MREESRTPLEGGLIRENARAFSGKVALVTGASSGIGKAIALGLAAEGAALCIVGRNLATLKPIAEEARRSVSRVYCFRADLTQDEDVRKLKESLHDIGRVDALVNSAGIIASGALETASVGDFDLHYRTNVRGPYVLAQSLLPLLKVNGGQVVFINSSVGQKATANVGQYAASKHALRAIADSLREEVNSQGIRVLSVYLGRTATPMQAAIYRSEGRQYQPEDLLQPEDVAAVVINALSLPLTAEVTDINLRPFKKPPDTKNPT